jgi:hypothetical protein
MHSAQIHKKMFFLFIFLVLKIIAWFQLLIEDVVEISSPFFNLKKKKTNLRIPQSYVNNTSKKSHKLKHKGALFWCHPCMSRKPNKGVNCMKVMHAMIFINICFIEFLKLQLHFRLHYLKNVWDLILLKQNIKIATEPKNCTRKIKIK